MQSEKYENLLRGAGVTALSQVSQGDGIKAKNIFSHYFVQLVTYWALFSPSLPTLYSPRLKKCLTHLISPCH